MHISISNLTKTFDKVRALDNLSLEISEGQIVSILGLNGAGKTTLLRCLSGLAKPTKGIIRYDGEEFRRSRLDLRKRFFFLPDLPAAFAEMTPVRHVGMVLRLYGKEHDVAPDVVVRMFQELDLLPLIDSPLSHLSRGQLYKTALVALLSVDPEVWLLDEPFASGMDPYGLAYFKKAARAAAGRGRTILYSTQILEIAENFCDRVCVIDRGSLRLDDTLDSLKRYAHGGGGVLEEVFARMREGPLE